MAAPKQRTLRKDVTLDGIGVHSGEASTLTFRPAAAGTGIRFRRVDLDGSPEVPADLDHVAGTELGTSLSEGDVTVLTVEHVLAGLAAHHVDNAVLELSGPEPPIRDGSFLDFYNAVKDAGVQELDTDARCVQVRGPVHVDGGKGVSYVCAPNEGYRISATIDFDHPAIRRQFASFDFGEGVFPVEIAPARTFGFREHAAALQARGLARGASLENTVVLDESAVMNDGLRFPDEFVRHKIGDMIGDLSLLGARIQGHVVAQRPSHAGNVALARALRIHGSDGDTPRLEASEIMQYLPHRYPMLLVDRIVGFERGKRIVGLKNVTINEPFFMGHYPGHPIMPGVLIIEAMAQVGGLLLMDYVEDPEDKVVYFMSLDEVKWRRPVIPGDQIVFELELLQFRRGVCKMAGVGKVDGNVVAEAKLMARVMDR
ncbi:MAG TPA: UDP-3-O-acyl-N-acetylglucosamine deacetylase [Longimicrobiales bacterium]|nr:UDP-3-O-acyl-N-acetylglucosamine deacetylase [Longimicrobiales bacterium]